MSERRSSERGRFLKYGRRPVQLQADAEKEPGWRLREEDVPIYTVTAPPPPPPPPFLLLFSLWFAAIKWKAEIK